MKIAKLFVRPVVFAVILAVMVIVNWGGANLRAAGSIANLGISVSPTLAAVEGEDLTINFTVGNYGPNAATGIEIILSLSSAPGFDFDPDANPGCLLDSPTVIKCGPSDLNPPEMGSRMPRTMSVSVVIVPNAVGTLKVAANIFSSETDPTSSNNIAKSKITVTAAPVSAAVPDLGVIMSAPLPPATADSGDTISYAVKVKNNSGSLTAEGVRVSDQLPHEFIDASATITAGTGTCSPPDADRTIVCDLNDIGPSASAEVRFNVTVVGSGEVANSISVRSVPVCPGPGGCAAIVDPDPANDSVLFHINVVSTEPGADLETSMFSSPPMPAFLSSEMTYQVRVENHGPDTAENVVLTDTLPDQLDYVNSSIGDGGGVPCVYTAATREIRCPLGSMTTGSSIDTIITLRAAALGEGANDNITASSDTADPGLNPNTVLFNFEIINRPGDGGGEGVALTDLAVSFADADIANDTADEDVGGVAVTRIMGARVRHTLTVTNNSDTDANNVVVNFDGVDSPAGSVIFRRFGVGSRFLCERAGDSEVDVECTLDFLGGRDSADIWIDYYLPAGSSLISTAVASSDGDDVNDANNRAGITTSIAGSGLGGGGGDGPVSSDMLTISAEGIPTGGILGGSEIVLSITINNVGSSDAPVVILTGNFGSGLSLVSTSAGDSCTPPETIERTGGTTVNIFQCTLGAIGSGGSLPLEIRLRAGTFGTSHIALSVAPYVQDGIRLSLIDEGNWINNSVEADIVVGSTDLGPPAGGPSAKSGGCSLIR